MYIRANYYTTPGISERFLEISAEEKAFEVVIISDSNGYMPKICNYIGTGKLIRLVGTRQVGKFEEIDGKLHLFEMK